MTINVAGPKSVASPFLTPGAPASSRLFRRNMVRENVVRGLCRQGRSQAIPPPSNQTMPPGSSKDVRSEKTASQHRLVRPSRPGRLFASKLDEKPGLSRRPVRRPPGDRHLQHLVRAHALQRPSQGSRRAGEARRLRGGRLSPGIPGVLHRREQSPPDCDAVPQPRRDGRGRGDPRQSRRRRGAHDRLRQDHPCPSDGCRELRRARYRLLRRADAERQVPGPGHRLRHRCLALFRDGARRRNEPPGIHGRRGQHVALARPLHGDGHRLDHELYGRSAWA